MSNPDAARSPGLHRLPAPHDRVALRISVHGSRPDNVIVEYHGTDAELIAAGIVPEDFFTPCPGRKRFDAAGRWTHFGRLRGVTRLHFSGDPLLAPSLHGVTLEAIAEARAAYGRLHGRIAGLGHRKPRGYLRLVIDNDNTVRP